MDTKSPNPAAPDAAAADTARRLVELVRALVAETQRSAPQAIELDSRLAEDLGIDGLARVELNLRCEKAFGRRLDDVQLATLSTPREVLDALLGAAGAAPRAKPEAMVEAAAEAYSGSPEGATTLTQVLDWHVERHAGRTHITLLVDDEHALRLTYGELREGALRVAAALIERDLTPERSCALMLPTSLDFFGCSMTTGLKYLHIAIRDFGTTRTPARTFGHRRGTQRLPRAALLGLSSDPGPHPGSMNS